MDWDEKTEEKFKQLVYNVSKGATANVLNAVDAIKSADDIRVGDLKKFDSLKSSLRGAIMNFQNELLYGIKLLIETGELPESIDKRGQMKKTEQNEESNI